MSQSESHSEIVLELAEQFLERYRRGERPSLKEYIDHHPELAVEIREVFPALAMMENIALADESIAGSRTTFEGMRLKTADSLPNQRFACCVVGCVHELAGAMQ